MKPYILWRDHKKIVEQGYTHLGGAVGGRAYDEDYEQDQDGPDREGAAANARVSQNGNGGQNGHEQMAEEHVSGVLSVCNTCLD